MFQFKRIAIFAMSTTIATACAAQGQRALFDSTIDANTRWSFRAISPVTVTSPIVRLSDIVEPLDSTQSGWQRLGRAAVGLVPVSGEPMTIQRDRLNKIILSAEATPSFIDWHGPKEIHVTYRKSDEREPIQQTAFHEDVGNAESQNVQTPQLSSVDAQRVIHWIELSVKRFYPDVADSYQISVPENQPGLADLQYLSGVTHMEFVTPIADGSCRFTMAARSAAGPIETQLEIILTAHPKLVVPTRSLGRGQRIEARDLELKPFPVDQVDPQSVVDLEMLVGQEVRSPLQIGRPIKHDSVGSPILVHRGDLIELRVIGGGVSVTTNAKAIGDGAESDLIEIETLNPRKRLIARVARHGSVEIVTRAPIVR